MSQYDNEIYRGPPETGPTLGRDMLSRGAEFYVVKPPQTTAQQDEPATEESILQESKPTPKKKSRIGKAMKLLASCAATVAVMTSLAAPAAPAAPAEPVPELPLWPHIGSMDNEYVSSWTHFPISQNSEDCQVSIDGKVYCLTAKQEGVYLHWVSSREQKLWQDFPHCFYLDISIPAENLSDRLVFCVNPIMKAENLKSTVVKILTTSGKALYVHGGWNVTSPNAQQILDNLNNYIQISDVTADVNADGWDYVLIGDTMYSETNEAWSGIQTVPPYDESDIVEIWEICHTAAASYSADDFICRRQVNDIDWSFYFASYLGNHTMWAVPAQEDVALGFQIGYINYYNNKNWNMRGEMSDSEIQEKLQDELLDLVDRFIIGKGLCHYYPVEQIPERKPADIPPDATVPSTEATTEAVTVPLYQCETNGHIWVDANYQAPKTCSVCGETEGGALLADFEAHGLPINITQLDTEYDYLTSSANDPELKTWGKLSITDYRVFDGDEKHPALEGYEWHTVSVKIRFDDNVALYKGMSFHDSIENYYDIEGWDATQTYLEEENMIRYGCTVNGTDYTQCLYKRDNTEWSGWIDNPETGISECSVTFDQYIRIPVGYDGVVFGYYDGGVDWGEGQYIYDIADGNTLFFRLDGALARRMTEPTEVFPRTDVIVLYEYEESGNTYKGTQTIHYNMYGEVIKTEWHDYEDDALYYYRSESVQDGYTVYEEVSYNENGHIDLRKVRDDQNGIYMTEEFSFYESGAVRAHGIFYYQDGSASQMVEEYQEEYDEGGTVIDTDHQIYDPETGFWILEDVEGGYSTSYGASYGTTGEMWSVDTYGDGLFGTDNPMSNEHLYSGIYQETFSETGNLWNDVQINEDGSGKNIWYYPDGSLEQSVVTTIDEETNTWIQIVEYHPAPSDDFCYRTEERVRFDDAGNIVEYYSNQTNGNIIEIPFDRMEQSNVEYDQVGRVVKREYTGEDYIFIAYYDRWGRLKRVGIRMTHYG